VLQVIFLLRILKGWPRLYNHVQLSFFVYLELFKRYSTFCSWLGFPYFRLNCGGFWAKWPPKQQMREKHMLGGYFLTPNCVFWAIVREIIYIRLACACAQEQKAAKEEGRKEGRKDESHKKCIFHVCVEQPLADGFQLNLTHVFSTWTLSNVQSFIVITWEDSELWGVSMLPWGTKAVLNTLLSATALQVFGLVWFILRPCQHDNGYIDGRSQIKVHTDERCRWKLISWLKYC